MPLRIVQVVATPFGTNLDHLRCADECQYKFDHTLRALGPEFSLLPVFGVGHSLGAVINLLICSRYAVAVSSEEWGQWGPMPAASYPYTLTGSVLLLLHSRCSRWPPPFAIGSIIL